MIEAVTAAAAVTLVTTPLVMRAARRWQVLDRPNRRSSHVVPIPRGGGLAILAGVAAGWIVAGAPVLSPPFSGVLVGVVLMASTGLLDDRFGLPVGARLLVQGAAAAAVCGTAGSLQRLPLPAPLDVPLGAASVPVTILWIVAVTNFFNFLDGIDGLAALQVAITGVGVAVAAWHPEAALTGAVLAAASCAFLAFNWTPARVFMGDVGSLTLGYTMAALPMLAPLDSRPAAVCWMGTSLWLFLADAAATLGRRLMRRQRLHEAHREHFYQRLVDAGMGHGIVAGAVGGASAILTLAALVSWRGGPEARWLGLMLAVALFAAEAALVRRRERNAAASGAQAPRAAGSDVRSR